jgi:transcriptional regulator with XRE-family HTH domain
MSWEQIVGHNIRRLRKERDLTQEKLALDAKMDLRYLGGIERGEHNPTVEMMGRLAEVLGVHPRDFFDDALGDSEEP